MSTNGHVVTPKAVEIAGSNRRQQRTNKSEKVRLDGNVARRKVMDKEFFWWDTELPGFGLRAFAAGSKSLPGCRRLRVTHLDDGPVLDAAERIGAFIADAMRDEHSLNSNTMCDIGVPIHDR